MPGLRPLLLAIGLCAAGAAHAADALRDLPTPVVPFAGSLDLPPAAGAQPDIAFGAFQRGYYVTAFNEAMKRITANPKDAAAMALVGEIYDQGLGVRRAFTEAARWFRLATTLGNREATFALAMSTREGRGA